MHPGLEPFINQIHHMDYLDMLRELPDESVDCVLTDPPYGMGYVSHRGEYKHKMLTNDKTDFSYHPLAVEAFRVLKTGGCIYAFTRWDKYPDHYKHLQEAGFIMREPVIGQKNPSWWGAPGSFEANSDWALFAHKGKGFAFRPTQLVRNRNAGKCPSDSDIPTPEFKTRFPAVWFGPEFPRSTAGRATQAKYKHPTVKGLRFIEWMIMISTDVGGVVVDPFSGSGTTATAAQRTGRNFIASEYSKKFVEMGRARLGELMNARRIVT